MSTSARVLALPAMDPDEFDRIIEHIHYREEAARREVIDRLRVYVLDMGTDGDPENIRAGLLRELER